ncbi:hypothetical protein U1Q18_026254 [Sarracenia purpurea var. burkii]
MLADRGEKRAKEGAGEAPGKVLETLEGEMRLRPAIIGRRNQGEGTTASGGRTVRHRIIPASQNEEHADHQVE